MNALILAGGENRRFMSQKALAEVNGRRIIETTAELLKKRFTQVYISTNTPEIFFYLGLPMIGDVLEQRGPMTGIYSGLESTGADELFIVACDMPFVAAGLVDLLKKRFEGQDALIPVFKGKPEPLLGIYSGRIKAQMKQQIAHNRKALWDLYHLVNTVYLSEDEIRTVDPEGRSFININTLEEYRDIIIHI